MELTKPLRDWLIQHRGIDPKASDDAFRKAAGEALSSGALDTETFNELIAEKAKTAREVIRDLIREEKGTRMTTKTQPDPNKMFRDGSDIRVLPASERYNKARKTGRHVKTQQPVQYLGRDVEQASEYDRAMFGLIVKNYFRQNGVQLNWTEHDQQFLQEIVEEQSWCGLAHGQHFEGMLPTSMKAPLLGTSTSGGNDLIPTVLDNMIISDLLTHSELLPYVTIRDVGARTLETPTAGPVSVTWNTTEGSAVGDFDCSDMFDKISTSVFPVDFVMEVSLTLLDDALPDVGSFLMSHVTERMLCELDKVIAVGNGTSQPLGLFNTSGVVATPVTNSGGTIVWADVENLIAALPKPYRARNLSPMFVANDTTYFRFRGIPQVTGGNMRVGGNDTYASYQLGEYPFKVQGDIPNTDMAFVAMRKYWLLRRSGLSMMWERGGKTLVTERKALLSANARFGGRIIDANAVAVFENLPA